MKKYFVFCNGIYTGVYYGRNIWEGEVIEFYIESYKNLGIGGSDPVTVVEQKDFLGNLLQNGDKGVYEYLSKT